MLTPSARRTCATGRPKKVKNTIGRARFVTLKAGTRQRIRSSLLVWANSMFSTGATAGVVMGASSSRETPPRDRRR